MSSKTCKYCILERAYRTFIRDRDSESLLAVQILLNRPDGDLCFVYSDKQWSSILENRIKCVLGRCTSTVDVADHV